jgi:hypothetical protein
MGIIKCVWEGTFHTSTPPPAPLTCASVDGDRPPQALADEGLGLLKVQIEAHLLERGCF